MAEVRRHTNEYVFHHPHSVLYTATPMAKILLKVTNVVRSENLAVYGNQHSLHPKKYKK